MGRRKLEGEEAHRVIAALDTIEEGELLRPSEVFARRLRSLRKSRGVTGAALSRRMNAAGRPMTKWKLTRLEAGTRGISLDEALAFAWCLNAAPAHMLTPPEGALTEVAEGVGLGGAFVREWLRFGSLEEEEARAERDWEARTEHLARLARTLVDAWDGGDRDGVTDAARAMARAFAPKRR